MGTILLLALAAAVYPQLLAVVVVILTRPNPRPLLIICWLTGILVSLASSGVVYAVFRHRGTVIGTSSQRLGPAAYLVGGTIALLIAIALATRRAPARADDAAPPAAPADDAPPPAACTDDAPPPAARPAGTRIERALEQGSFVVAGVAGVLLAIPGPFDLLAVGRLARGGHTAIVALAVMAAFAVIKFALIEVPIAGYLVDPGGTAARVGRFSAWLHANKLIAGAGVLGLVGVVLIVRGISALA